METTTTPARNSLWVARYAKGITALGVFVLICGLAFGWIATAEWFIKQSKPSGWVIASAFVGTAAISLTGLLALGLANLLAYVLGVSRRPGWILRHADRGLYLLAVLRLLGLVFGALHRAQVGAIHNWFGQLLLPGVSSITGALVLVALGLVLHRVLPVIAESRTLV